MYINIQYPFAQHVASALEVHTGEQDKREVKASSHWIKPRVPGLEPSVL